MLTEKTFLLNVFFVCSNRPYDVELIVFTNFFCHFESDIHSLLNVFNRYVINKNFFSGVTYTAPVVGPVIKKLFSKFKLLRLNKKKIRPRPI